LETITNSAAFIDNDGNKKSPTAAGLFQKNRFLF